MIETTLYCKDNTGKMRAWSISIQGIELVMQYGYIGGSIQEKRERVPYGKAGRTQEQQIRLQYESRVNRQLDKGYVADIEKAKQGMKNRLGFHKPMLAKVFKNVRDIDYKSAFIQHKYDGHRCLITKKHGEIIAYSRNGKLIESIGHILKDVHLQEGETIDGELYCHGVPLQRISSWVKAKQPESKNLNFIGYDMISGSEYAKRLLQLGSSIDEQSTCIHVAPTSRVDSAEEATFHFQNSRMQGYEGSIVRWGFDGYEDGKRSKHLVKIKAAFDDEFPVVDIKSSKDGWAILICMTRDGKEFAVSAPGTMHQKKMILEQKEDHIGLNVSVEYANLTKDGIPFHPVAVRFREDI